MSGKQQWHEQWYENRVRLWRNLCDALNALEEAGERPGLNTVEENGAVTLRFINGENAEVNHCDGQPWTLALAVNALNRDIYQAGDRVTYAEEAGTVKEVLPAGGLTPVERLDVQWDSGKRSAVWVSDIALTGHETP
ncbi:hypothetical protein [Streptomyces sp. NPDC046925]|uniref:hypothetical protein n=1 Tax=Streptomyces sp. NPDC046925 TaxID=3155375 RepID=UPI0033E91CC1